MAHIVSEIWYAVEHSLYPYLEAALQGELSGCHKQVVAALELIRIEEHVPPASWQMRGRPRASRASIARAFVAKSVLGISLTKGLREALLADHVLRRICGFKRRGDVPSESTLSRAFSEFAKAELGRHVHEAITRQHVGDRVVMHVCRDSTAIEAREKPAPRIREVKTPQKRGPKGKNAPPRELKRLEKQRDQTPEEAFAEISTVCNKGCKLDSHGNPRYWIGYKEHIDWTDNSFPLTVRITSASVHDSQIAIPMAKYTANRFTVLYELMDAAYDAGHIREAIRELGHVPIIVVSPYHKKLQPLCPAAERRYNVRSAAERGNSRLKDEFGCRNIRVRGAAKVHQHVMFGVLALCADVLVKMATGST